MLESYEVENAPEAQEIPPESSAGDIGGHIIVQDFMGESSQSIKTISNKLLRGMSTSIDSVDLSILLHTQPCGWLPSLHNMQFPFHATGSRQHSTDRTTKSMFTQLVPAGSKALATPIAISARSGWIFLHRFVGRGA